ncbi:MAG TPA: hypothetical protein VM689_19710 [Aliidongia sp.]|nr:hypothetical protein [Aliidongia sp.]
MSLQKRPVGARRAAHARLVLGWDAENDDALPLRSGASGDTFQGTEVEVRRLRRAGAVLSSPHGKRWAITAAIAFIATGFIDAFIEGFSLYSACMYPRIAWPPLDSEEDEREEVPISWSGDARD